MSGFDKPLFRVAISLVSCFAIIMFFYPRNRPQEVPEQSDQTAYRNAIETEQLSLARVQPDDTNPSHTPVVNPQPATAKSGFEEEQNIQVQNPYGTIPYDKILPDRSLDEQYLRPLAEKGHPGAECLYGGRLQVAVSEQLNKGYKNLTKSERDQLEETFRRAEHYLLLCVAKTTEPEMMAALHALYLFEHEGQSELFRPNEALAWGILDAMEFSSKKDFILEALYTTAHDGTQLYSYEDIQNALELAVVFSEIYGVTYDSELAEVISEEL